MRRTEPILSVYETDLIPTGLPPGQKHHISTAPDIRRSIRERWFAMSKEEQVAATEDGYQQTLARLTRSGTTQTARLIRQIGERVRPSIRSFRYSLLRKYPIAGVVEGI